MAPLGKRLKSARESVDLKRVYSLNNAIFMIQSMAKANFDETVEVAISLSLDSRRTDQIVRGVVRLPNGTGRMMNVAVFARDAKAKEAESAGADVVGSENLVERIQSGDIPFDRIIATPDMMVLVGRLGKILGPRGLMPNPRVGTVTFDVAQAVKDAKGGSVEFRAEKAGLIHAGVGKVSFHLQAIEQNIIALARAVQQAKPSGTKDPFLKRVTVTSTMGLGIKVDPSTILTVS
ncbi:50S ribosomal protein L1 [Candidatus Endowatersipora endosymbiont of Watersipora subatra]|uniref:50S ribosomal protein L1 n=1 Tax=Candidatus Endowatersipora endosymbiont of Watersipora subatra TaxID=3077946 RepID=UPI00312CB8C7